MFLQILAHSVTFPTQEFLLQNFIYILYYFYCLVVDRSFSVVHLLDFDI